MHKYKIISIHRKNKKINTQSTTYSVSFSHTCIYIHNKRTGVCRYLKNGHPHQLFFLVDLLNILQFKFDYNY